MKIANPLLASTPKVLAHSSTPTETPGYSVHMEIVNDPKDGQQYLVLGVGGAKRTQRARLTKAQTLDMVIKLQPLAMML